MISGLFLAGMSVDRLIAVRFPMAAARLCTTKRAKVTVISTTVSIGIVNIQRFYVFEYMEDLETGTVQYMYMYKPVPLKVLTKYLKSSGINHLTTAASFSSCRMWYSD
jgi:hypothetical protein